MTFSGAYTSHYLYATSNCMFFLLLKKENIDFPLYCITACEKPCDNLWWHSWAVSWSCRTISNWREGISSDYYFPFVFNSLFQLGKVLT